MQHIYDTFTSAYKGLLKDVYENPDYVCSPRGQNIKEKLCVKFIIKNPRARLPFIEARGFNVGYCVAENLWYLSGENSTAWISYYAKFWESISDDGQIANSAYGSRIFKSHQYCAKDSQTDMWNQWLWILDELCADNDSRRAVVHIRTPYDSKYAKKDVPCTLTLQFLLRNDKLNLIVSMRSSDLLLGIGNDIPAFTLFQELMALQLSKRLQRVIDVGEYMHVSNSLHIYERNFVQAEKMIAEQQLFDIPMPKMVSEPPVQFLYNFEQQVRNSNNPLLVFNSTELLQLDDYWKDWCKILVSHRFGKLGDPIKQKKILDSTSWSGYHYFSK